MIQKIAFIIIIISNNNNIQTFLFQRGQKPLSWLLKTYFVSILRTWGVNYSVEAT
jgi:hypothetical protein